MGKRAQRRRHKVSHSCPIHKQSDLFPSASIYGGCKGAISSHLLRHRFPRPFISVRVIDADLIIASERYSDSVTSCYGRPRQKDRHSRLSNTDDLGPAKRVEFDVVSRGRASVAVATERGRRKTVRGGKETPEIRLRRFLDLFRPTVASRRSPEKITSSYVYKD